MCDIVQCRAIPRNLESVMDYETRRDAIVVAAWETWTKNGLGLDDDMKVQTEKSVQDAVNNAYIEGISDKDWLAATLRDLPA
jgi:hypothetical protein